MGPARSIALGLLAACSFQHGEIPGPDQLDGGTGDGRNAGSDAVDAPSSGFVPVHVPVPGHAPGTGPLTLGTTTIDTSTLSIGTSLPPGTVFDVWPQTGGPDLAVLHVSTLTVSSGAIVRVIGSRALVVIASGTIEIDGTLDGGAHRDAPGAAGALPHAGSGAGGNGSESTTYYDSGGGGGGYGQPGAAGGGATGAVTVDGGAAGASYNDPSIPILVGGSGGGDPATSPTCGSTTGGAGGGAIQLSTPTAISIAGTVLGGGGGGDGGVNCNAGNWGAGGGGGSGGSIVLQASSITNQGRVAANGGAGGSGAGDPTGVNGGGPGVHGIAGADGQAGTTPAVPGSRVGKWSSAGGAGGALGSPAQVGVTNTDTQGNGGGGGGGVGRIVVLGAMPSGAGTWSPAAH